MTFLRIQLFRTYLYQKDGQYFCQIEDFKLKFAVIPESLLHQIVVADALFRFSSC